MRRLIIILILFACSLSASAQATQPDTLTFGNFGKVFIYKPVVPRQLVLFISGDGGWQYGVTAMAQALAGQGALVVGIDMVRYWKYVQHATTKCLYASGDFENLSQFIQKKYRFTSYHQPILCGYSSGATLVYGLMVQAPPQTYKGGIALAFCPDLAGKKPLCEGSGLKYTTLPGGRGFDLFPSQKLVNPFIVLLGELDPICDAEHTAVFMKSIPGKRIIRLPGVGHSLSKQTDWLVPFLQSYAAIVKHAEQKPVGLNDLKDLPLTELSCATPQDNRPLIVAISGDGGWKGFIDNLGKDFVPKGIPVVGMDALRYFWNTKTPEQTTVDMTNIIRYYLRKWNRKSFIVLGYSFGANVMPFVVNRLPEDLRNQLNMVVLLSPDKNAEFEFHFSSWLNKTYTTDFPLLKEMNHMKNVYTTVIYGKEETSKPWATFPDKNMDLIMVPGDHHYGYNHTAMANDIMSVINKIPERK